MLSEIWNWLIGNCWNHQWVLKQQGDVFGIDTGKDMPRGVYKIMECKKCGNLKRYQSVQ